MRGVRDNGARSGADYTRTATPFARQQEKLVQEAEVERQAAQRAEEKRLKDVARALELAAKAREREAQAAQAAHEKAERDRMRAAATAEREQAARAKAEAKALVDAQHAEARSRTDAILSAVSGFERVLHERAVELQGQAHEIGCVFDRGGADAFAAALDLAIAQSRSDLDILVGVTTRFHPESRELVVDCELPRQDVVPKVVAHRYRPREQDFRAEPRKDAEIRRIYRELVARTTLRVVAEVFYAASAPLVDSVVFNGFVSARDRATGQPVRPCVVSLVATREVMEGLLLDEPELDPVLCLGHLRAIVSPHPYDLEAVKPVTYFDPTRYKLIDEIGAISGLDHRLDLLTLSSVEFEYLIQRLFEAVGMKSWVKNTRA